MSAKLYIKTTKGDIVNQSLNQPMPRESGYQTRIRSGVLRLFGWNAIWGATCALMVFGPRYLWNKDLLFTLLAVGLNVATGVGMILSNVKYLSELDELQRKIYLNALGITGGVALIASVPFSVMDAYGVIPFHAKIWHLIVLMSLTFLGSNLYGTWRYR
jgi:hypothetical protein